MITEIEAPARPRITVEMVKECALAICKEQGWPENAADDIAREYRHPMDGFELCKKLDFHCSWDTERDDMEALDGLDSLVDAAIKKAETEWVEQYQITPPLPVGSVIIYSSGENLRGEITGICSYHPACYLVKPEGQDDATTGNRRWVIKFEDAKLAEGGAQ